MQRWIANGKLARLRSPRRDASLPRRRLCFGIKQRDDRPGGRRL